MSAEYELIQKFQSKSATIAILGLGYVGLPLALRFTSAGYKVIGFDIDEAKTKLLNSGKSYIAQVGGERIENAIDNGFSATIDFSKVNTCDGIILCVPTPLNKYREPDLSFVLKTLEQIIPHLRRGQILSLESTTYPGTTEEEITPRIRDLGYTLGDDFFVVYSPEREDPGNPIFSTKTIPKIIGGATPSCLSVGGAMYDAAIDRLVPVSNTKTAEMTKLLENIHRAVNIGLVNEMKVVADKMGINIHEVIEAAATKPFGFTKYSPGPGLGGHCIPIDPFYLTWKAKEYGLNTRFIELSGEINRSMPEWVVGKLMDALNERGKALNGSKILVLGIAYKKNVDDPRESPAVQIMELLRNKGARLDYSDPYIPVFPKMREHRFELKSIELTSESIGIYDAVVLATDHNDFNYELIEDYAQLIIDTRNRCNKFEHVISA